MINHLPHSIFKQREVWNMMYEMNARYWTDEQDQEPEYSESVFDREKYIESSPVSIEAIMAIKSLVTDILRARARTRMRNESTRSEGFAIIDRETQSVDEAYVYDGSVDRILSARVKQVEDDQWSMSVNVKTFVNEQERKAEFMWERFLFDWLETDESTNIMAWKRTEFHHGSINGERSVEVVESYPLSNDDCRNIQTAMFDIVDKAAPIDHEGMFNDSFDEDDGIR